MELATKDKAERLGAIRGLARQQDDGAIEVRIQAMRGLHVIDGEAAAASLGELALGDADPALRRQAVHLLATLRGDEARATVELAASDPDDAVRQAAEEALTRPRRWR